ncbi:MAG: serine/threonine-protein kinase [Pirellulaceae bacterium]
MTERDIFITALDKPTPEQRSEYLSVACAGDRTLRQRVEDLLRRHEQTGNFLQKSLVERLAEGVAALELTETEPDPFVAHKNNNDLRFLSPLDQPGSLGRLGHYEAKEVIGSGGMGIVLRAFDERLHRVVAIKVMAAPLATNAASRNRFLREARAAAAVCHDHIVTIHAVEESGDLPYIVMQCVTGMSLQERIDRDGPLALHEILRIGMQTAAGLAAAHAQGLIHRDIKPANILLENGVERVKITDFGLARAAADASVSQSGVIIGTPQYMAPEQARGEALDGRTDLFSLGSVLYAMCTGRAPFRAGNSMAVLKRVCDDAPSSIREASADVPESREGDS